MKSVTLIPRDLTFPVETSIDSGILESYDERIRSYGERARESLDIFLYGEDVLAGSNCFASIILRNLLPENLRLATMADLGLATEINPDFLSGFYSDTGLILRTAGDSYQSNDLLAKNLANQLKKRNITLEHPKVIYFDALNLEESQDSDYGLVYKLNERAKLGENIFDAPELTEDFSFRTMDERGIPIKDIEGNRQSYVREKGLSGFCLLRDSYVYSGNLLLAISDDDGRVVFVDTKGIAP